MEQLFTPEVKMDTFKFGSAEIGKRAVPLGLNSLMDVAWMKSTVLILLGFAVYQLAVRRVISTDFASGSLKLALDDILKFGTMLVFKQLAENKSFASLNDAQWKSDSAFVLLGFVTYDFVTRHVYDTSSLSGPVKASVDDAIKFGTMFVVSQFLSGKPFDNNFLMTSGGFIAGLVAYNFLLASRV